MSFILNDIRKVDFLITYKNYNVFFKGETNVLYVT